MTAALSFACPKCAAPEDEPCISLRGLGTLARPHHQRAELLGHPQAPLSELFWQKVDRRGDDECWPWTGARGRAGYGLFTAASRREREGRSAAPHRFAYEEMCGPIPPGLQLDHVCHTLDTSCDLGQGCPHRLCVNPAHLEPVTALDNTRRARPANRTHCPAGHAYTPENTTRWNKCLTCHRRNQSAYLARRAAA